MHQVNQNCINELNLFGYTLLAKFKKPEVINCSWT